MNKHIPKINYLAVLVAALAAFIVGAVWYGLLFGNAYLELRGLNAAAADMTPQIWVVLAQFVRDLIVAFVLAYFVTRIGVADWKSALELGLLVWIGFQAMAIVGAVLHEGYALGLYAIHAGDALVKTLLMSVILGVWQREKESNKKNTEN